MTTFAIIFLMAFTPAQDKVRAPKIETAEVARMPLFTASETDCDCSECLVKVAQDFFNP